MVKKKATDLLETEICRTLISSRTMFVSVYDVHFVVVLWKLMMMSD